VNHTTSIIVKLAAVAVVAAVVYTWVGAAAPPAQPQPLDPVNMPVAETPELDQLWRRIANDPEAPAWKRRLIEPIQNRGVSSFQAKVTMYCPANSIDPQGGGAYGAWHGIRLRRGHCAVGCTTRAVPYGTVLYCPDVIDHLLIAVDCGPGVNGSNRLDICLPNPTEYLAADRHNWKMYPCWVLGKVSAAEAR